MQPVANSRHSPRANAAVALAPPRQEDTFEQRLAAEIDDPEIPPEERPSLESLRQKLLEWHRENQGLPPADTEILDLASLDLRRLPASIGLLTNIRHLNLRDNQLREIPPEIGRLTNLEILTLSDCRLTRLPAEIGELQNLEMLEATGNQLTALPAQIGRLQNLRELHLGQNRLERLPPEIGQLEDLEQLSLNANALSELPTEIGRLRNLRWLDASSNHIGELPDSVGEMQNLMDLGLRDNLLVNLPASIGQLANLVDLNVSRNQFVAVPAAMESLNAHINLNHNIRLSESGHFLIRPASAGRTILAGGTSLPQDLVRSLALYTAEGLRAAESVGNDVADAESESDESESGESDLDEEQRADLERREREELGRMQAEVEEMEAYAAAAFGERANALAHLEPLPGMAEAHAAQAMQGLFPAQAFIISREERAELSIHDGEPIEHADSFMDWLDRMGDTRDYRDENLRPGLEASLNQLIADLRSDVQLRTTCFAIAAEGLSSCGDRVTVAFNLMHEAAMVAKVLRPGIDERTLMQLGVDTFVMKLVNTQARNKIAQLEAAANAQGHRWGEDIETMLFFQTKLRTLLAPDIKVPLPAQGMLYERCAGVSEEEIATAARSIRATYHDGESLINFLANDWPPLRQYIDTTYAAELAEVETNIRAQMEDVEDRSEDPEFGDANYATVANELMAELEIQQSDLRKQLMNTVIGRYFGAPGA